MANYTHKAIIHTFEEMLHEMPFDKITVSALVERCEISSNTFYYHFRDIYDLLDAWNLQKKADFAKTLSPDAGWTDSLKALLTTMQEHPKLVNHLMKSVSRDRVECFSISKMKDLFDATIRKRCVGTLSEEQIQDLSEFCCFSTLGCILKFIYSGMTADIDRTVDKLQFQTEAVFEKMLSKTV